MKECKCSKILPCYRGGYGVWHHSDYTRDKVYELNKQMCDMGNIMDTQCFWDVVYAQIKASREASERRFAKYIKQNEDIMEEKKTKKMTKAEAFEYLKGKKVLCYSSKMEAVQSFVKSFGFHWSDYSQEPMLVSILFLGKDGRLTYSASLKQFEEHGYEVISAEDILSIEIVEEKKEPLDRWEEFASKVAKIQETLEDDEVCIITKTNYLTMTK